MLAQERYDAIKKLLLERNAIKVTEIMKSCQVSHETVRRDLEYMQEIGLARRVHGGAVLIPQKAAEQIPSGNASPLPRRKLRAGNIAAAQAAAKLVHPGDTILLDSGRTMSHIAQFLRDTPDLTVITASLFVIHELLGTDVHVISLGGDLQHDEYCFSGNTTQSMMSMFNVDKAFISCAGLPLKQGYITEYDFYGISRQMIRDHADQMILVINSEKLQMRAMVNNFPLSKIDTIVVDDRIQKDDQELIHKTGIELVIAPITEHMELLEDESE